MAKAHPYIKNISFEVTTPPGYVPPTDAPRDLTEDEISIVRGLGRLEAIKRHRAWTNSTLLAAIRRVDAAREG